MNAKAGARRSLAFDVVATAILQLVAKLRGLLLLPIITRVGDVALYGAWTQLSGALALLTPLVNLSVHQGVVRFAASLEPSAARAVFQRALRFSILSGGASALLLGGLVLGPLRSSAVALVGERSDLAMVLLVTLVQLPFAAAARVTSSFLRARRRVAASQLLDLVLQTVVTVVACAAFLLGGGLLGAQATVAVVTIVGALAFAWRVPRLSDDLAGTEGAVRPTLGQMLHYSWPFVPNAVSDWVLHLSDRYVLASWHSLETVGLYAGAYGLAQAIQLASFPIEYAVTPRLPRLWDGGHHDQLASLVRGSVVAVFAALVPGVAMLAAAGPVVLRVLGSEGMRGATPLMFALLAAGILALAVARLTSLVLLVSGRSRLVLKMVALCAAANLLGNLILVPDLAVLGAAGATFLAYFVYAVATVWQANRILPGLLPVARLIRFGAAALLASPVLLLGDRDPTQGLGIALGYFVTYLLACAILRATSLAELRSAVRAATSSKE